LRIRSLAACTTGTRESSIRKRQDARDVARALAGTDAFEQSRRERKRAEMLFPHLKRILRLGRLRLRGPRGAQDEFMLAAIAQNLRRLAKLVARPPPKAAMCLA
jgi:Transposase DDE domain